VSQACRSASSGVLCCRRTARGPSRLWGCPIEQGITGRVFLRLGIRNGADFVPVEDGNRHASGQAMGFCCKVFSGRLIG